jgi:hypothetical protein
MSRQACDDLQVETLEGKIVVTDGDGNLIDIVEGEDFDQERYDYELWSAGVYPDADGTFDPTAPREHDGDGTPPGAADDLDDRLPW